MYPEHARTQAERILATFEQRQAQAAHWLGIEPAGHATIFLVDDYEGMRRAGGDGVPEWAVAICRRDDRLVFRLDKVGQTPATSLDLVLLHEVIHQVLNHAGGLPLPRWFEEGLCVYRTGVAYFEPDTTLQRLAAGGNLPRFAEADALLQTDARRAAWVYNLGQSAVARFILRFGDGALRALIANTAKGMPFPSAFYKATGERLDTFEDDWRASVTPRLPFLVWILLENFELTLLFVGALIVFLAWVRYRLRRPRELAELDALS